MIWCGVCFVVTNHISDPARATVCVCVSVCLSVCLTVYLSVRTITFEINDLWPRLLAYWFNLTFSRTTLKVKVISSRSRRFTVGCGCKLRRHVFLIAVEFFVPKWSVITQMRAFSWNNKNYIHSWRQTEPYYTNMLWKLQLASWLLTKLHRNVTFTITNTL